MIFDTLNRLAQYKGICLGLDKLIDFTLSHELNALPAGRNEIDGDLAWMNVNVAPRRHRLHRQPREGSRSPGHEPV